MVKAMLGIILLQEDVVMGTLTVRENLRFSAALRLPSSVPQSEKEARVNHLIKELGLTKVADSKVHSHTCVVTSSSFRHLSLKIIFHLVMKMNTIFNHESNFQSNVRPEIFFFAN